MSFKEDFAGHVANIALERMMGQQESYLQMVVTAMGMSIEDFVENYELEYKNIQTEYDTLASTVTIRFSQEFRVVPKEKK